ncbi:hypothetical protein [Thiocystis violascens]|uniref:Uncharacterized protein n=1 Tax=Thiocystis violascens (strain ATCC 17096 / DSM 198 / 6111) TaxID=765911 RepID=I3Y952_THIV6|nr:hypothetical protein [Thiocystis violascens]AFL73520.1 hypothetical protein Thivi_1524 [Thiocystis violascens DSM 198]
MKKDEGASREAVLRLLTEGVDLPLAPLPRLHLEVIAEALIHIWQCVVGELPEAVIGSGETLLNTAMINAINRRLSDDDPPLELLATFVFRAERGTESQNYKGDRLEVRPDISFSLKGRGAISLFPLIVECKIIDGPGRKTVRLYCDEGLKRFVDGDYGWARQEAFMLAYVRDASTIADKLIPFLEQTFGKDPDRFATLRLPAPTGSGADQAESQHSRPFRYPDRSPEVDPGPITIRHIWVNARPPRRGESA